MKRSQLRSTLLGMVGMGLVSVFFACSQGVTPSPIPTTTTSSTSTSVSSSSSSSTSRSSTTTSTARTTTTSGGTTTTSTSTSTVTTTTQAFIYTTTPVHDLYESGDQGLGIFSDLYVAPDSSAYITHSGSMRLAMTKVSFSGIQSSFTVHDDGVNRCMYNSIAGQGSNLSIAFINEHAAYVKYLYYTSSEAFNFNSWSVPVTLETDVQLSQNHVQYSGATPWIAFMSGPAGVMVGSFESGTWDLSTIEPRIINSPENQIDLKFTSDFLPRVSFWGFTANCVSYDAWNGSGWDKASVVTDFPGGGDGKFPALDVDSGGHSHLAFISSGGSLQYTNNVSGSWRSPDTLAQFDFHNPGPVALAIDGISVAHVICVNSTGEVWYFNNRTGSWRGQIVGIGTTEGNVAIKLTTTNKVKAIYTTSATTIEYIQEQ